MVCNHLTTRSSPMLIGCTLFDQINKCIAWIIFRHKIIQFPKAGVMISNFWFPGIPGIKACWLYAPNPTSGGNYECTLYGHNGKHIITMITRSAKSLIACGWLFPLTGLYDSFIHLRDSIVYMAEYLETLRYGWGNVMFHGPFGVVQMRLLNLVT